MSIVKCTFTSVWDNGEHIDDWPCDVGGSNASVEHSIRYKGKIYSVITDWDNNLRWPDRKIGDSSELD